MVHHGGDNSAGLYAYTLQVVDIRSGWSERKAFLGRNEGAVKQAMEELLQKVPFAVKRVHFDNGSEFINEGMIALLKRLYAGTIQIERSRPYQKNDNRYIEERNRHQVRDTIGYGRLDTPEQVKLLNEIYERQRWYNNLYQPMMHLSEKGMKTVNGIVTIKRKHTDILTPYARVIRLNENGVGNQVLEDIRKQYETTNLVKLVADMERKTQQLWNLPNAATTKG